MNTSKIGVFNSFVLIATLLPLAFDFRADESGGSIFQYMLFFLTLTAGLIGWARWGSSAPKNKSLFLLSYFIFGSLIPLLFENVLLEYFIRVYSSYLLFFVGYLFSTAVLKQIGVIVFGRVLIFSLVISMIFSFLYGLQSVGGDLSSARYQILSSGLLVLFAYCMVDIQFKPGAGVFGWAVATLIILLIVASVTRSWIVSCALIFYFVVWIQSDGWTKFGLRAIRISVAMTVILVIVLILMSPIYPYVYDRWVDRLFHFEEVGVDLTTLTRIAEIDNQLLMWRSDLSCFIFGCGLGREYIMDGGYLNVLISILGDSFASDVYFEAGHNFWVYSLFSGGLLFGWVIPFLILYEIFKFTKLRNIADRMLTVDECKMYMFSGVAMFAFVASTIGGNPFVQRYSGLIYGVCFGLLSLFNLTLRRRGAHG